MSSTSSPSPETEVQPSPLPVEAQTEPSRPVATMSPAECAAALKSRFPALFTGPAKPLKLRIQADIQERAPGVFTKAVLSAFLRRYTGGTGYLIALGKAQHRFDLDGQPAGELSQEHRDAAQQELARRRELQQQRHVEEEQQRHHRALLLRDFSRTTLTVQNFCALKGIAPEALEPLLAQAREEALQAPAADPRDRHSRPGRGERGGARPDARGPRGNGPRQHGPRQGQRQGGQGGHGAQPARAPRLDSAAQPPTNTPTDAGAVSPASTVAGPDSESGH